MGVLAFKLTNNDVTKDGPNLVVSEGDSGPRDPGATTGGLKHRALI